MVRENDGRKLDHKTLEVLRMRAIEQVAAGAHPEEVAVTMGFHKNTVYGWLAKAREGGKDALKATAVPGRPPRLDATQMWFSHSKGRIELHVGDIDISSVSDSDL